jgi:hypothetical protein
MHLSVPPRREFILILAVYLLIALGLTLTLLAVGNSALVGVQYDGALSLWSIWWPAHAFATNQNLAFTDYILFPIQTNVFPLLSITLSVIYLPLAHLLQPFLGYHVLLVICLWLNAASGYAFLRRDIPAIDLPAFFGGLAIAFNPLTWIFASRGEFALLAIFPLLWALKSWTRLVKQPNFLNTIFLIAALYLTILSSIQFWNLLLTFWLLYVIWTLPEQKAPLYDWLLLGGLLFLGAVAFYPTSNFLWSTYAPLYRPLEVWQGTVNPAIWFWIGIVLISVVLRRLVLALPNGAISGLRFWTLVIILHIVLFAAPQFAPLSLLNIPQLTGLTQSAIFLLPVVIAVTVIGVEAARFYRNRIQTVSHRQIILATLGLIVLSGWLIPLPRTPLPDAELYTPLENDPENYTIIDFPIGVDSLARHSNSTSNTETYPTFGINYRAGLTLAYVPWHGKRVVGGLVNSLNDHDLDIYRNSTLAQIVAFSQPSADRFVTAKSLREELASWRVGYMIIHSEDGDATQLRQWLTWTGTFCIVANEEGTQLWRSRWHPAGCPAYQIDIGSPDDAMALEDGWYTPEAWPEQSIRWAGPVQDSTLSLWAVPSADYTLHIQASAPGVPNQQVEVWANGQRFGTFRPGENWEEETFSLSGTNLPSNGLLNIELRHEVVVTRDGRSLTTVYDYIMLSPADDT